jgi:HD-like signal output (HDOD) protein
MKPAPAATPRPTGHQEAFAFVQELAAELNRGTVDLPSFPDIALRVRQVLADDSVSTEQVVRVINSEPALAAQLLRISNSRPMNSSGRRSAAIGFAMAQLKRVEGLKGLEQPLDQLWQRSAAVAAMCYVVARRHTRVNADSALLAGMLHGIGKLYILTRSAKHPALFNDQASLNEVIRDWSAPIAKALLENWSMPAEIVTAVSEFEDHGREHDGAVDLTDVLTVSSMLAVFKQWPAEIELNLQDVRACARMHMDMAAYERLISESDTELDALHQALGM